MKAYLAISFLCFITALTAQPVKPAITGHRPLTTNEDVSITIRPTDLMVSNAPNYPVGYEVIILEGANYNFDGATVTPSANYAGQISVFIQVFLGSDPTYLSERATVTISVLPVDDPPTTFRLLGPATGSTLDNITTFSWSTSIDPEGQAIKYDIKFDYDGGPTWFLDVVGTEIVINIPFFTSIVNRPVTWSVTAKDGNGNKTTSLEVYSFQSIVTGITETRAVTLYPNPAKGRLIVTLDEPGECYLRLFDLRGMNMMEQRSSGKGTITLDVSHLSRGVYILSVKGETTSLIRVVLD